MQQVYDSSIKMYQSTPYSYRTLPPTFNEELQSPYNNTNGYSNTYFRQPCQYSDAYDNSNCTNSSLSSNNSFYSFSQNFDQNTQSSPTSYSASYSTYRNISRSSPNSFPTCIQNNLQFHLFASPLCNRGNIRNNCSYTNYSNVLPINLSSDYSTSDQSIKEISISNYKDKSDTNISQHKDEKKSTSFITNELMSIEGLLFIC